MHVGHDILSLDSWLLWCLVNSFFISVHFGGGLWAVLAGPLFTRVTGVLYDGHKVKFQTFGWHMLGGVAIFVWSGITVFLILLLFVCTSIAKYKNDRGRHAIIVLNYILHFRIKPVCVSVCVCVYLSAIGSQTMRTTMMKLLSGKLT